MNKKEILKKVIENNGGIAKTSDFAANGINKYEVATFCKKGVIERIRRGFYQFPQSNSTTEEQLIRKLLPQGIVCVESALFHYGYSDFSPREWSIAVPRTAFRAVKNIEEFPMKAYYIQKEFPNVRGGFIHVPYAVSQVVNKPATPSMAIADITAALEAAVKAAVEYEQDIKVIGGETH